MKVLFSGLLDFGAKAFNKILKSEPNQNDTARIAFPDAPEASPAKRRKVLAERCWITEEERSCLWIKRQKLVAALRNAQTWPTEAALPNDDNSVFSVACQTIEKLYSSDLLALLANRFPTPGETLRYPVKPNEKEELNVALSLLEQPPPHLLHVAESQDFSRDIDTICDDLRAVLCQKPIPSLLNTGGAQASRRSSSSLDVTASSSQPESTAVEARLQASGPVCVLSAAKYIPGAFPDDCTAALPVNAVEGDKRATSGCIKIIDPGIASPPLHHVSPFLFRGKTLKSVNRHLHRSDPSKNGYLSSKMDSAMHSRGDMLPGRRPFAKLTAIRPRRQRKVAYRGHSRVASIFGLCADESEVQSYAFHRDLPIVGTHERAARNRAKLSIIERLDPPGHPFQDDADIDTSRNGIRMTIGCRRADSVASAGEIEPALQISQLAISDEKEGDLGDHGAKQQLHADQQYHEQQQERERIDNEKRRLVEQRRLLESGGLRSPRQRLVCELAGNWKKDVMATLSGGSADIVKTKSGNPLRAHDFEKVVHPQAWLNDEIVNGSLEWLDDYINSTTPSAHRKCLSLSSFFWSTIKAGRNTDRALRRAGIPNAEAFLALETLFVPICASNHWTLVVVRPQKRTLVHMDSMKPGGSPVVLATVREWVKRVCGDKFVDEQWSIAKYRSPLQTNGYDCGAHVITNGICVALGVDPAEAYKASDMPLQRLRIAGMLLNKGFTGDFQLNKL